MNPAQPSPEERFLVTGAHGCVGAWVVARLVSEGSPVVTFDLSDDPKRLRLLLTPQEIAGVPHVLGDISDLENVERALDEHEITNVIHLAALQVPFCRADPPLGARVNVVGTVNVLEAVSRRRERMRQVVYASSVAAFDAVEEGATEPAMVGTPGTLYGVYKRANEGTARVYWQESGVSSVGLRPHTVYGPGRDQGLTSAPTTAMLAAAAGVPYRIPYGGSSQLQYGRDVAQAFIAASRADYEGASVHNLSGPPASMAEVVEAIANAVPESAGSITFDDVVLPFPAETDGGSFTALVGSLPETPLEVGVGETVVRFRELLAAGLLLPPPTPEQTRR